MNNIFHDSLHVWVSENFQKLILPHYNGKRVNYGKSYNFDIRYSKKVVQLSDIVFSTIEEALEVISYHIKKKLKGGSGELLNDSSANTFFVYDGEGALYSILVRWESAQKLWRCGAYLQESFNMPNIRIFSPEKKLGE